jgi:hypothetical protein
MDINSRLLWDIFKHASSWLTNLDRAGEARKIHSIRALREVVKASRETAVYMRHMKDSGNRDHATESHLSILWTDLGYALEDLGISKLAKRCQINGKHWADPEHYDEEFLEKADVSLERMERIANEILIQIKR